MDRNSVHPSAEDDVGVEAKRSSAPLRVSPHGRKDLSMTSESSSEWVLPGHVPDDLRAEQRTDRAFMIFGFKGAVEAAHGLR